MTKATKSQIAKLHTRTWLRPQKAKYPSYMQGHDQGHKKPNTQATYKDMTKATKSQIAKLHARTWPWPQKAKYPSYMQGHDHGHQKPNSQATCTCKLKDKERKDKKWGLYDKMVIVVSIRPSWSGKHLAICPKIPKKWPGAKHFPIQPSNSVSEYITVTHLVTWHKFNLISDDFTIILKYLQKRKLSKVTILVWTFISD